MGAASAGESSPFSVAFCTCITGTPACMLATAWKSGHSAPAYLKGVYGRLVYLRPGITEKTAHLVDPIRRVARVADGEFWASTITLPAREIFERNGIQKTFIDGVAKEGTRIRLVLFDDDVGNVWPANWDGVRRVINTHYAGGVSAKMMQHWPVLRNTTWEDLEKTAGERFEMLDRKEGPMTEDRYLLAPNTVANARRFLAAELSLNRLFTGTGFTVDDLKTGGKGVAEYFAENVPLSTIPLNQIIPIDID